MGPPHRLRGASGARRGARRCGRWRRGSGPPPRRTVPRPWGPPGPRKGGPSEVFAVAPIAAFAALASARASAAAGLGRDDVVNPKHHDRRVRRRGDGLAPDPDRLDHVLFLHVGDFAAEDVDPCILVPLLVLLPQLDQDVDRVQARVFREGARDDLDGVRERFDGDLLAPTDGRREVSKRQGDLHGTRTAAGDDLAVLDRDCDDARRVLEGPLELVDHVFRAPAQEDRDRLRVLASRHEGHLVVADLLLVHLLREAEIVLRQLVELGDDLASGRLRELLHVRFLDPANRVDLLLCQVVLREVVDALLAEDHGRAALPHDLDHALQHCLFLVQEGLELGRVRDLDLRVDLRLLDLKGRVDERDLWVLHLGGHPGMHAFLVDDDAVDELRVRDRTALLLHDLNIVIVDEVRSVGALLRDRRHRLHRGVGQELLVAAGGLGRHRRHSDLLQGVEVLDRNLRRDLLENLAGLLRGLAVPGRNHGRMDVLVDQVLRLLEQLSRQDDGRRGAVAGFLVLGLRDLDEHLGRGVFDVNLLEDRDAVVGDDDVPEAVHEHLVHSAGAQGRAHRIRNRLRGRDVVELRSLAALAARPFLQDQYRRTCWHHVSSSEYRIRTSRLCWDFYISVASEVKPGHASPSHRLCGVTVRPRLRDLVRGRPSIWIADVNRSTWLPIILYQERR